MCRLLKRCVDLPVAHGPAVCGVLWAAMVLGQAGPSWAAEGPLQPESALPLDERPQLEQLIQQLGAESYAVRRQAFAELWRLGSMAEELVQAACQSPDKQIAESARRLRLLIKVGAQCDDVQSARELAEYFLVPRDDNLIELAKRGQWRLAAAFLQEHAAYTIRAQESFYQQASSRYVIQALVDEALAQGQVDRAWPLVAQLVPADLAAWTAASSICR